MKTIHFLIPVVALIACGCAGTGSGSSDSGGGGTPTTTVQMTGSHSFNPTNVTVPAGSTVQWKNIDTSHHTVASDTNVSKFNSDPAFPSGLPGGTTFNWTVPATATSGTVFFYHCEIHGTAGDGTHLGGGMAGSVTVQ
jgi:plastocyanin